VRQLRASDARVKSSVCYAVAGKHAAELARDSALAVKNGVLLDTIAELIAAGTTIDVAVSAALLDKDAAVAAVQAERDADAAASVAAATAAAAEERAAAESATAAAVSSKNTALMAMAAAVMQEAVTEQQLSVLQAHNQHHLNLVLQLKQDLAMKEASLEIWETYGKLDSPAIAAADAAAAAALAERAAAAAVATGVEVASDGA
jgi:hypothetical protein